LRSVEGREFRLADFAKELDTKLLLERFGNYTTRVVAEGRP